MGSTSTMPPETWTMRGAREAFGTLAAPAPAALTGDWDGRLTGNARLVALSRAIAVGTPLRGWCGKSVTGDHVQNLVRRAGQVRPSASARLIAGTSRLDGRACVVVDYSAARRPIRWLRGELRWWRQPEQVVGILLLRIGGRAVGPFPFLLTRRTLR
jgi:hypothetical protein